jgi:hypothetical protein
VQTLLSNAAFLCFLPFRLVADRKPNKKAGLTKGIILRQLGRLGFLRPVAFRPLLAKSLALSGTI